MLTEGQNHRIWDILKTVYPTKTPFCRGIVTNKINPSHKWDLRKQCRPRSDQKLQNRVYVHSLITGIFAKNYANFLVYSTFHDLSWAFFFFKIFVLQTKGYNFSV